MPDGASGRMGVPGGGLHLSVFPGALECGGSAKILVTRSSALTRATCLPCHTVS